MDTLKAIFTRRSIRKYSGMEVSDEQEKILLDAAMSAPSAGNQQPWHFVAIRDQTILEAIPKFHQYSGMLPDASLAILICGDPTLERYKGYWVQDCSAATENLLIAANGLGLGAVWLGVYPEKNRVEGLRELLDIPEHIIPLSLISIGYPLQASTKIDRFKPERIHKNKW